MTTLKGLFGTSKPRCSRNFIRENARQLRDMQGCKRREEVRDTVPGRSSANRSENVPARTPCHNVSKNNDQSMKESLMRNSNLSEKGYVTEKCFTSNINVSKRNRGNDASVNGDTAALVHQQLVSVSRKGTEEAASPMELPLDISELPSVCSERVHTVCVGSQTIDPKHFNKLLNEGVIKYPANKLRDSENSLHTREIGLQTDMTPSLVMIDNAASDTLMSCERNDLALQNLSLSDLKEVVEEPAVKSPEVDYIKTNVKSVKTRQRSVVQAANNSLKAPPTHQRGAIPKYLRERQQAWEEAEQRRRIASDTACPPGHVMLPDSERMETLKLLKKRYAEFVQQLNMLPVSMDTLKVRNRKIELEKELNKLEEGIKVFSRPKVFVTIDA